MNCRFNKSIKKLFNRELAASTLIETITASVIFMIIFIMAMDTMTRLFVFDSIDTDYIVMENDIKKCRRKINQKELYSGRETYRYEWGEIEVEITNYKDNVYQVDLIATSVKKHRRIGYRFLQAIHE